MQIEIRIIDIDRCMLNWKLIKPLKCEYVIKLVQGNVCVLIISLVIVL